MRHVPEFGTRAPGRTYVVRPGVHALITDGSGRVGVMRTPTGFYLPGGGIEANESPEVALAREVREECGRTIVVGSWIGEAIEHVHAVSEGFFSKHCQFFHGRFASDLSQPVETDHALHFVAPHRACALLRHASHRSAVDTVIDKASQTPASVRVPTTANRRPCHTYSPIPCRLNCIPGGLRSTASGPAAPSLFPAMTRLLYPETHSFLVGQYHPAERSPGSRTGKHSRLSGTGRT